MTGRTEVLPSLACQAGLDVCNARTYRKQETAWPQDPMHRGKSSVEVVYMLKDMQCNYQIEGGVVEAHGLDVPLIHVKTFASSIGQRRVRVIQAPGLEPGVVLNGPKQVPLPAANLKGPDDLACRIKATNPASE